MIKLLQKWWTKQRKIREITLALALNSLSVRHSPISVCIWVSFTGKHFQHVKILWRGQHGQVNKKKFIIVIIITLSNSLNLTVSITTTLKDFDNF